MFKKAEIRFKKVKNPKGTNRYVTIDLKNLMKEPVDEITDEELSNVTDNLPANVVKLPKDESMKDPGQNAKAFTYTVKKGDTLKKISEMFGVSYGELSNHLLNKNGNTSIYADQVIEIPRLFVDLSSA